MHNKNVDIMKQSEFYDSIFKIQDSATGISNILKSIGTVEDSSRKDAMVCNVERFIQSWYDNNMKFYSGWFWDVRKKILRGMLGDHYQELIGQLKGISAVNTDEM